MQALRKSYKGLSLIADLNWDRALSVLALVISLTASAWLMSH